ncbi:MAG: nucleotide exchange factor GrpE [Rhodospirillaceae bacterium]
MQQTPDTLNPENTPGTEEATESKDKQQPADDLQQRLEKAEQAAQEHRDAWLRAVADSDNIRKRAQAEVSNAHKFALESFAAELLPVKDSLEAALASENVTVESLRSGEELTLKQLRAALEKFNVTEVNPVGQKFDPHRHQAISMVESDAEPNTVVQVLQKGYLLHDRVLRPALVTVAKAKNA